MTGVSPDGHMLKAVWPTTGGVLELRCADTTCPGRGQAVASCAPSAVTFTIYAIRDAISAHRRDTARRTGPPVAVRPSERPY